MKHLCTIISRFVPRKNIVTLSLLRTFVTFARLHRRLTWSLGSLGNRIPGYSWLQKDENNPGMTTFITLGRFRPARAGVLSPGCPSSRDPSLTRGTEILGTIRRAVDLGGHSGLPGSPLSSRTWIPLKSSSGQGSLGPGFLWAQVY